MARTSFSKVPPLDTETVESILANVYTNCHVSGMSGSFESLVSYSKYRKERHTFERIIAFVVLIGLIVLPVLFVRPDFVITTDAGPNEYNVYTIDVATPLPIRSVIAEIDGLQIPIYEQDLHEYTIQPVKAGDMTVTVTLFNDQSVSQVVTIQ